MPKAITRGDRPAPTTNAGATTDHVCDVMSNLCRDLSIEQLLCRQLMALEMAVAVCQRQGTVGEEVAARVLDGVAAIRAIDPDLEAALHDVCRIALNSRKRGDLRKDQY